MAASCAIGTRLWMEVRNVVQEAVIKTIPKKKKGKKANWLSKETLQIAVKRETKNKGEKERYTHLNAEFQRTASRDKKAFLNSLNYEYQPSFEFFFLTFLPIWHTVLLPHLSDLFF